MVKKKAFKKTGFYFHMHWAFDYPFSVRYWSIEDYSKMFRFLRLLDIDRIMIWPMVEMTTFPLSEEDSLWVKKIRAIIEDAQKNNLECWLTFSLAIAAAQEELEFPIEARNFFHGVRRYVQHDSAAAHEYSQRLAGWLSVLNNADGYVFIDGDPGGYENAKAEDYRDLIALAFDIIKKRGTHSSKQKVIPWLWYGWGNVWSWQYNWPPLLERAIDVLKQNPLPEPWELLPGRSHLDTTKLEGGHANGRKAFELVEKAELLERSTLMTYEIIEFEPTPPGFVVQYDHIRRVLKTELPLAGQVQGVFGNAQQPVDALHNLFFFAKAAKDPEYLEKTDTEILTEYAIFLGGDPALLVPALNCLSLGVLDDNLPAALRRSSLSGGAATELIPGGADFYLNALATFVEARIEILKVISSSPATENQAAEYCVTVLNALQNWWKMHKFVSSGGSDFSLRFIPQRLCNSWLDWFKSLKNRFDTQSIIALIAKQSAFPGNGNVIKSLMEL